MTQEELPLELDPYPGYWRVTIYEPCFPPLIYWFSYEDKKIAEEVIAQATPIQKLYKEPTIKLDTEFEPSEYERPWDEDEEYWGY